MLYCSSDCGSISLDHAVTHNLLQYACTYIMYIQRSDSKQHDALKALSHGAAQFSWQLATQFYSLEMQISDECLIC